MKKLIYLIAIVGFVMVSCAKPNDTPNPKEEKMYSIEIGAEKESGGTDETRVEMVDGLMHWSVGDMAYLSMYYYHNDTRNGSVFSYLELTSNNTQPTRNTTFRAEFSEMDMYNLYLDEQHYENPFSNDFQYLSYHVSLAYYNAGLWDGYNYHPAGFGSVWDTTLKRWGLSVNNLVDQVVVPKNEFSSDYVIMAAEIKDAPMLTWLEQVPHDDDNDGYAERYEAVQHWNERLTFKYKHTLAYLRVKLGENTTGHTFDHFALRNDNPFSNNIHFTFRSGNTFVWSPETNVYERKGYTIPSGYPGYDQIEVYFYDKTQYPQRVDSDDYFYVPIPSTNIDTTYGGTLYFIFGDNIDYYAKAVPVSALGISTLEGGKIYDITIQTHKAD